MYLHFLAFFNTNVVQVVQICIYGSQMTHLSDIVDTMTVIMWVNVWAVQYDHHYSAEL